MSTSFYVDFVEKHSGPCAVLPERSFNEGGQIAQAAEVTFLTAGEMLDRPASLADIRLIRLPPQADDEEMLFLRRVRDGAVGWLVYHWSNVQAGGAADSPARFRIGCRCNHLLITRTASQPPTSGTPATVWPDRHACVSPAARPMSWVR